MSYYIPFTDGSNNQPIPVGDRTLNTSTSLTFVGRNFAGYAPFIAKNFLSLLENFSNGTAPSNPIRGQLWFDSTTSELKLNIAGTDNSWVSTNGITKSNSQPSSGYLGELWVDTFNNQLYTYSGSQWVLVGPQLKLASKTGLEIESIIGIDGNSRDIVSFYSNNNIVVTISDLSEFAPRTSIGGFPTIKPGITISTNHIIWGTTNNALQLDSRPASSYFRIDQNNTFEHDLTLTKGIKIGNTLGLNIYNDTSTSFLVSKNPIAFTIQTGNKTYNSLYMTSDYKVAVGKNNITPASALDVSGTITINNNSTSGELGKLLINNTSSDSITTVGGISIGESVVVAKNLSLTNGIVTLQKLSSTTNLPEVGPIIIPSVDGKYDIGRVGSDTRRFRNIYSVNFTGSSFNGTTFTGNLIGTASKIATSAITDKAIVTDTHMNDQLLIYRDNNLFRIDKQTFVSDNIVNPIGSIIMFAGNGTIPSGYLECNGQTISNVTYPVLCTVLGATVVPNIPHASLKYIIYTGVYVA